MERRDEQKAEKAGSNRYTRKQLLDSEKYRNQQDCLCALLDDKKVYSVTEVNQIVNKFMKGKVNVC